MALYQFKNSPISAILAGIRVWGSKYAPYPKADNNLKEGEIKRVLSVIKKTNGECLTLGSISDDDSYSFQFRRNIGLMFYEAYLRANEQERKNMLDWLNKNV